jgi:DNA-binding response OmpR family regulator
MTVKRTLVVEDDRAIFELIKSYLENQGLEIKNATNSKDAMKMLMNEDFCFTIVDNGLPDIEGYKLVKQIRNFNKNIKIIMLTGTHKEELEKKAKENGADIFLVKDMDMQFLSNIEKILDNE